jgi:hypothetical protein
MVVKEQVPLETIDRWFNEHKMGLRDVLIFQFNPMFLTVLYDQTEEQMKQAAKEKERRAG